MRPDPRNVPSRSIHARASIALAVVLASVTFARTDEETVLAPREIMARAGPAVVVIEVEKSGGVGQGSGFLATSDGAIVTSLHVVDGADRVTVEFPDGERLSDVTVRSFDVRRDLAVLVVELGSTDPRRTPLDLGDPASIDAGDRILVIGTPLGLDQTITQGIVSAWRDPDGDGEADDEDSHRARLRLPECRVLQISADIAAGSSGGPVFDERGQVVGVAVSGVAGAAGLNFAIPVDPLPELLGEDESLDLEEFQTRIDDARARIARPHLERAQVAYERGERRLALRLVERALAAFPRYTEALLLAGRMAMESGDLDRAERRFREAVGIDDRNADAWYLLGRVLELVGIVDDDAARKMEAESSYGRALDLDGRHGGAAYRLAVIVAGRGMLDRAEELLRVAIDSEPGLANAHAMMGEIHFARDRIEDAKDSFEQALWEDENNALAHFGLARVFTVVDRSPFGGTAQYGPAADHWREFLRLSEGDPSLAEQREAAFRIIRRYFPHLLER